MNPTPGEDFAAQGELRALLQGYWKPHAAVAAVRLGGSMTSGPRGVQTPVRKVTEETWPSPIPRSDMTMRVAPGCTFAFVDVNLRDGATGPVIAERIARHYLEPLFSGPEAADCLLLGCTHFPALMPETAFFGGIENRISALALAAR